MDSAPHSCTTEHMSMPSQKSQFFPNSILTCSVIWGTGFNCKLVINRRQEHVWWKSSG